MNSTVGEADLDTSYTWVKSSWTDNKFYAIFTPTHSDDYSEASSNSGTNTSASSEEATVPEYNTDSDGPPPTCALLLSEGEMVAPMSHSQ